MVLDMTSNRFEVKGRYLYTFEYTKKHDNQE